MGPLLSLAFTLHSPILAPDDAAQPLATRIAEVSVHPGSARVTRIGTLPGGDGRYVVSGLPAVVQPDAVGLRLDGGEANGVEVRPRIVRQAAEERVAALQQRVDELSKAHDAATDAHSLERALRVRLEALLDQEAEFHAREVAAGRTNEAAWAGNLDYLDQQLRAAKRSERTAQWAVEEAAAALDAARAELGRVQGQGEQRVHDVLFDVVALRAGPIELELDYVVSNAGWSSRYDLRADKELARVELIYRAEVAQQTGEDWRDVEVFLSTAEPRRGVVGPEAPTLWLSLLEESDRRAEKLAHARLGRLREELARDSAEAPAAAPGMAAVHHEGLSLRYRLARSETIESRPGTSTVLVGRADLAVTGERVCTPALDPSVWVRGRTRNTSDWVMLPGPASVFFGNDFLGAASVAMVRPGEEFTLHLGLDPGLAVTRTHVDDQRGTAGLFGSKETKSDRWRIEIENHGTLAAGSDGSVTVRVREVLPKTTDDRIDVELESCQPAPLIDARAAREREENGVLTWAVPVARGGKARIEWATRIEWPDDFELERAGGIVFAGGSRGAGALPWLLLALSAALAASGWILWRRREPAGRIAAARGLPAGATGVVVALALSGVSAAEAAAQQAVESRIDLVTVDGSGAMVERVMSLPGAGSYLVPGLPAEADPASVRVRVAGGEVVGVDVRERRERTLPDARLQALRETVNRLGRELSQLEDEKAALDELAEHLTKLLAPAGAPPESAAPDGARPGAQAWALEQEFLRSRAVAQQRARRENAAAIEAKQQELAAARAELERGEPMNVVLRDVSIEVVSAGSGALQCTLTYRVGSAGWAPAYELRAASDLTGVELTYRARVWQQTAEDWNDIDLWLSTAQPRLGAEGPEPRPEWLTLRSLEAPQAGAAVAGEERAALRALGYVEADGEAEPGLADLAIRAAPIAAVSDEGLSVRFHLPDRQTVTSRGEGQVVLIGRSDLPLAPERHCVPALDPTVWLRGKAKNDSVWTLLPGETAVHLGNDYLGKGALELTQPGQEFTLHLGPDPFVTVERVKLEDQLETSILSTKGVARHAWRLRFENHGAPSTARDGGIEVIVRESLPKPRDERITVRLDSARPEPSRTENDAKLRDEKGVLTWLLPIARSGKAQIEWRWSAGYPEGATLLTTSE